MTGDGCTAYTGRLGTPSSPGSHVQSAVRPPGEAASRSCLNGAQSMSISSLIMIDTLMYGVSMVTCRPYVLRNWRHLRVVGCCVRCSHTHAEGPGSTCSVPSRRVSCTGSSACGILRPWRFEKLKDISNLLLSPLLMISLAVLFKCIRNLCLIIVRMVLTKFGFPQSCIPPLESDCHWNEEHWNESTRLELFRSCRVYVVDTDLKSLLSVVESYLGNHLASLPVLLVRVALQPSTSTMRVKVWSCQVDNWG